MALNSLEAYDLFRFAEVYQQRLIVTCSELSQKRGVQAEKEWMTLACAALQTACEPAAGLFERVPFLPELASVRDEYAAVYQGLWVDALEKLLAGFTFHTSNKDPIVEALFPHQKFLQLRRPSKETVQAYQTEFERRSKSSYVLRMLGQPVYGFAKPVMEQVIAAFAKWKNALDGDALAEQEAARVRKELLDAAAKLETVLQQVRLIAEAALIPIVGMFEDAGLAAKPRKRPKAVSIEKEISADPGGEREEDAPVDTDPESGPEAEAELQKEEAGTAVQVEPEEEDKVSSSENKKPDEA